MGKFSEPSIEALHQWLRAMVGRRVAVIGDVMLDAYMLGGVARISPEAPVPVFEIEDEEFMLGGAANVAKSLVALGAQVKLCGVIGKDANGDLFRNEALGLGIDTRGVLADAGRPTTLKSRVVARQQQVIRIDRETTAALSAGIEKRLIVQVRKVAAWADAVLLSDYSKGVLTEPVARAAITAARPTPVVVDPKQLPWDMYRGATVFKPNRREAQQFCGFALLDHTDAGRAARQLRKKLNVKNVLITRGRFGMTLVHAAAAGRAGGSSNHVLHLPSRPREVFDVTGAGDVVAATLTLALAAGADVKDATWLANLAAGVKVGKFGAATVNGQEMIEALDAGRAGYERKLISKRAAATLGADLRRRGKKVVFTNGCFDILHIGHVSYLERSRREGDALIVGINTDKSARRLKGPGRPVQNERDRAHIVGAQQCVDAVVLFEDDTPIKLIKAIKPDVLTKGADYKSKKDVVGWDLVESWGGRVALIQLVEGRSTSKLIRKSSR
ncbi:MAG: D-glycero-beta-D-manno-heptose 1-phosphate adenylyltransferase [Phycisphaeraceae bacterium]